MTLSLWNPNKVVSEPRFCVLWFSQAKNHFLSTREVEALKVIEAVFCGRGNSLFMRRSRHE